MSYLLRLCKLTLCRGICCWVFLQRRRQLELQIGTFLPDAPLTQCWCLRRLHDDPSVFAQTMMNPTLSLGEAGGIVCKLSTQLKGRDMQLQHTAKPQLLVVPHQRHSGMAECCPSHRESSCNPRFTRARRDSGKNRNLLLTQFLLARGK